MASNSLQAISPIDGRYALKTKDLQIVFSEMALMRERLFVEVHWLIHLNTLSLPDFPTFSDKASKQLERWVEGFSLEDAEAIKTIEKTTNHDVKAIEYFLRERCLTHSELKDCVEFIHFGCTSEDINNLSYALMLKKGVHSVLFPHIKELMALLSAFAQAQAGLPMLSRTHGQAASPTTVAKELNNVLDRLARQFSGLKQQAFLGKFNGAVGNFNAHCVAYPEEDWPGIAAAFVESLGLQYTPMTTQIEPHDFMAELFHGLSRLNTILIDFARDTWGYISVGYYAQKSVAGEVGSSTMPHKINPIDFENAEGNLSLANALFRFLAERLPVSRWQRDLVDSTLLRNIGVAFAHMLIALQSLEKGVQKLKTVPERLQEDLTAHPEVLAEAIQTVMRRHGLPNPYEQLKDFTRGKPALTFEALHAFIDTIDLPDPDKEALKALRPETYLGILGA